LAFNLGLITQQEKVSGGKPIIEGIYAQAVAWWRKAGQGNVTIKREGFTTEKPLSWRLLSIKQYGA